VPINSWVVHIQDLMRSHFWPNSWMSYLTGLSGEA